MPKIEKIGLKAARTENKKPLEILSSLKNVMKRKKAGREKPKTKKAGLSAAVNKKNAAEKQRNNSAPVRKTSIPCTKKVF